VIGTPFFVFFGWLSDKIGRKPIILTGCALAALTYFPLFGALTQAANPALAAAQRSAPVRLVVDPGHCSVQFDPIGRNKFDSRTCDVAKAFLAKAGVPYTAARWPRDANANAVPSRTQFVIGNRMVLEMDDGTLLDPATRKDVVKGYQAVMQAALVEAGYPARADPAQVNKPLVVAILTALILMVTMVYGPIAAMLVELFPSRIRYTSMSLPYHIGNGWFGGFLPATAFAMVAATGDIYYGLWYPVVVAGVTVVLGLFLLPETFRRSIDG